MSGSGVKRGEGVRASPAAPLRTGYPAGKSHLSLFLLLLNPLRGHGAVERCNLSLKAPEKTQVPRERGSTSINPRRRRQMCTWGVSLPTHCERREGSTVCGESRIGCADVCGSFHQLAAEASALWIRFPAATMTFTLLGLILT